ncbi:ejaculatory bulb-specific protein 3-like [Agrilus planipennis]|uniref:Ejaculatory bulb-specific protein 3-like n=1 Tax=Agrilus planipennis TaxID=224129 RepID=A0A1W4XMF3_AGRPL|nr:ejaculatory bulb-specific protein 3-like [Agrilus planipennis]
MKALTVLILVFCLTNSLAEYQYSTHYTSLDLESIFSNEKIMSNYMNCFLDKGSCTPEATEFKRDIAHALTTNCSDCSAEQKKIMRKACSHIMKNTPEKWSMLVKKFDPDNKYTDAFIKFINMD